MSVDNFRCAFYRPTSDDSRFKQSRAARWTKKRTWQLQCKRRRRQRARARDVVLPPPNGTRRLHRGQSARARSCCIRREFAPFCRLLYKANLINCCLVFCSKAGRKAFVRILALLDLLLRDIAAAFLQPSARFLSNMRKQPRRENIQLNSFD